MTRDGEKHHSDTPSRPRAVLARRKCVAAGIAIIFAFLVFWYAAEVVLLVFAGLLLALLLRGLSDWVSVRTPSCRRLGRSSF